MAAVAESDAARDAAGREQGGAPQFGREGGIAFVELLGGPVERDREVLTDPEGVELLEVGHGESRPS
jgi:hypothetical protein